MINRCPCGHRNGSRHAYDTSTTEYKRGIDRHALQRVVCVMDRQGKKLVHTNVKHNDFEFFLKLVAPYRHDLTVCCECMFGWYGLSDACQETGLTFVLAHALYVRAIRGGKNKNDRIDSKELTHKSAFRDYALIKTVPDIGENLDLTILHEIGDITRFPTVKDFLFWVDCRKFLDRPAASDRRAGRQGEVRLAPGSAPPD